MIIFECFTANRLKLIMIIKKLKILGLYLAIFAFASMPAIAQQGGGTDTSSIIDMEATVVENKSNDEEFVEGSAQNFSKLYWRLGALSVENEKAVDNFLLINECELYESFQFDEFLWYDLVTATKNMLKTKRNEFPNKFKFRFTIDLGRYDTSRIGFPLVSDTAILNLRRVEIGGNSLSENICGMRNKEIEYYPRNVILVLNKPFTFELLELDEHLAQAFIVRRKYADYRLSDDEREAGYKRPVYLQLRVEFSHFQGIEKGTYGKSNLAVVYGKIVGIDIFEDRYSKTLLKTVDFTVSKRPRGSGAQRKEGDPPVKENFLGQ